MHKGTTAAGAGILALALSVLPAPAQADPPGTTSLAEVLAADGLELDTDWQDFDILDQAVNDVLAAKPDSAVALLADGETELTAFAPRDKAFRSLVKQLTGSRPRSEEATYAAVGSLGVDTVEYVLLYHVVTGPPITFEQAKAADGATLTMANGVTLTVDYKPRRDRLYLEDADPDNRSAVVIPWLADINAGNRQIAHGISQVLRPVDL
ncbi:fasciclin domain-containing protein [Nocardioides sp. GXQ0305]|uniref:fasciclin domain-containing protein n=1 Tax=Nocardioides sp. GXQ0305 TaxID=3423912 RepID=UPI003D7E8D5C